MNRRRLPNRRGSLTFSIECAGLNYTVTTSRFATAEVGEIFISTRKIGSAADTAARDCAIAASIALQYGAAPETLRRALCRDTNGQASGPLAAALDLLAEGGAHERR